MAIREIVFDTETTGLSPNGGRPDRRDRLRRDAQPHPDRAELPRLHQSRARHAGGRVRGARPLQRVPVGQAGLRRGGRAISSTFIGDAPPRRPQRVLRHRLRQRGARAASATRRIDEERVVDTLLIARRKHPFAQQQPRCAVPALRHRQFAPHQARRAARRRDPRRSLYGAARRPAGRPRPGDGTAPASPRPAAPSVAHRQAWPARAAAAPAHGGGASAAHGIFVATLGSTAVWREYLEEPGRGGRQGATLAWADGMSKPRRDESRPRGRLSHSGRAAVRRGDRLAGALRLGDALAVTAPRSRSDR